MELGVLSRRGATDSGYAGIGDLFDKRASFAPTLDFYRSRSRQFGRTSAPTIPHFVHTIRGPNDGTGTSSGHVSALMMARW
jgi:hypothetical protein